MMRRFVLAMALCVLLAPPAALARQTETHYYAAYLNDQKIGHMIERRRVEDRTVTTSETIQMTLQRLDVSMTVKVVRTYVETVEGEPKSFTVRQRMSGITAETNGEIRDGQIRLTRKVGEAEQQLELPYPTGALMPEGLRLLEKQQGYEPGTSYIAKQFDPDSGSALDVSVKVAGKETVDLLGNEVEAVRVSQRINAHGTEIPATMHVDEDGRPLRVEMPVGAMKIVMLKCDKAYALSPAKTTTDFFQEFLTELPQPIPTDARELKLTVRPTEGAELELPRTDSQSIARNPGGTFTITVRRLHVPEGQQTRYTGKAPEALEALKPTQYVQSDDVEIRAVASKVIGDERDAAKAAEKLARWVDGTILLKDLSVGYASASEVIRQKRGDCTEHSVLLTAMCRAVGIPARTATGMVYVGDFLGKKNVLGGHQWTQVYLDGRWIDIDPSRENPWQCANRITQSTGLGDSSEWAAMAKAFGTFTVLDVEFRK